MKRMNCRKLLIVILAAIASSGCTRKFGPTLAGGKPVEEWVQALSDPDAKLRKKAAEKLGNVGSSDPAVVPALCAALNDKNADVRCEVILALVKSGPGAKAAIGPLRAISQQERDTKVRTYAAKALEKLEE